MSLFAYKKQYLSLNAPSTIPSGNFQIQWLGPKWFQWTSKTGLQYLHFRNWWGKMFRGNETATNLFLKSGDTTFQEKYTMVVSLEKSPIDGQTSLFLRYTNEAPFPWPFVVDEFRVLSDGKLLGMSYPKFAPSLALPFLLQKQ